MALAASGRLSAAWTAGGRCSPWFCRGRKWPPARHRGCSGARPERQRHTGMLRHPGQLVQRELLQRDAVAQVLARLFVLQVARRVHTLEASPRWRALDALADTVDLLHKVA